MLVGNQSKDDAAAFEIEGGKVVLSTTDFFMPIVDDPFDFGRIAATNAISDIFAMGGKPIMAIAILGWPIEKLSPSVAQRVVDGGRQACADAGIALAGGHSIDSPEPIFGLAVTGICEKQHLKQNVSAKSGDLLYLTKPLGIGILSTAQKQKKLQDKHVNIARDLMCQLNSVGQILSTLAGVNAITDVTGFGFNGHLLEICEGSSLKAKIQMDSVPVITEAKHYHSLGCVPGGTHRNLASYGKKLAPMGESVSHILSDPQTSGGLLFSVNSDAKEEVEDLLQSLDLPSKPVGQLGEFEQSHIIVVE